MKDYYEILGVKSDAKRDEIKRAYHILASQFHPDKNNGNDKRFKEINEAYRVLSLDSSRSEYDRDFANHKDQKTKNKPAEEENTTSNVGLGFGGTLLVIILVKAFLSIIHDDPVTQKQNLNTEKTVSYQQNLNTEKLGVVDSENKTGGISVTKTGLAYCKDAQGPYSTYDSASNSCGCLDGYAYGDVSKQCISLVASRDETCSAKYRNTSFLKYDTDGKKYICDCNSGYYWNTDRTACFSDLEFNKECVSSYGVGSYSTKDTNGKRVCDCSRGYTWNGERNSCVTTASVNQICVRDVGRNSYYLGNVTNGKYNCSDPY